VVSRATLGGLLEVVANVGTSCSLHGSAFMMAGEAVGRLLY
jgi:hypothetical protein